MQPRWRVGSVTDAFTYAELDEILRGTGRNDAIRHERDRRLDRGTRRRPQLSVALHDAAIAGEQRRCMLGTASWCVGVNDGRRAGAAAPGAVVAGDRPEVASLGAPAAGIKHRSAGLVDKQPR